MKFVTDKKNLHRSKSDSIQRKPSSRRNYIIRQDSKKKHERIRSSEEIVEKKDG